MKDYFRFQKDEGNRRSVLKMMKFEGRGEKGMSGNRQNILWDSQTEEFRQRLAKDI